MSQVIGVQVSSLWIQVLVKSQTLGPSPVSSLWAQVKIHLFGSKSCLKS